MRLPSWALAPVLALWVAAVPARAAVRAWLDSTEVAPGDTVALTLEYDGQPNGQPDLAPLQKDFEVLDSNASTSIEIVNGRASARTQMTVSLSPRHAGRLTVPPITWSGEQSPSLALNVANAPGARRHLLAWVRAAWPGPAPTGLNAFARQIDDPHLARLVRELDRACYGGDAWRGDGLSAALSELPLPRPGAADRGTDPALAPLYPRVDEGYV